MEKREQVMEDDLLSVDEKKEVEQFNSWFSFPMFPIKEHKRVEEA
jgi:hypothetical protein